MALNSLFPASASQLLRWQVDTLNVFCHSLNQWVPFVLKSRECLKPLCAWVKLKQVLIDNALSGTVVKQKFVFKNCHPLVQFQFWILSGIAKNLKKKKNGKVSETLEPSGGMLSFFSLGKWQAVLKASKAEQMSLKSTLECVYCGSSSVVASSLSCMRFCVQRPAEQSSQKVWKQEITSPSEIKGSPLEPPQRTPVLQEDQHCPQRSCRGKPHASF